MATDPRDEGKKEKKWGDLYTRSVKLHRAKQLNMDYPRKSGKQKMADESLNLLFVCSKNQWRSPTAERVYGTHSLINTRSAGTSSTAKHQVTVNDIQWADIILTMEDKHLSRMKSDFPGPMKYKECYVLDIPDNYKYMDSDLIDEIISAVDPIIIADS